MVTSSRRQVYVALSDLTPSSSLPHVAASSAVDMDGCTCHRNGLCSTCEAWNDAVRFYRANLEMIVLV